MENKQLQTTTDKRSKTFLTKLKPRNESELIALIPLNKSIAIFKKEGNIEIVKTELLIVIHNVFQWFNETVNENHIENIIDQVIEKGYMMTGPDFELFEKNCISGKYKNRVEMVEGKEILIKFFKLSPDVFIDWFETYILDRGETFANIQIKKHQDLKNEKIDLSEGAKKVLKGFGQKWDTKHTPPQPKPLTTNLKEAIEVLAAITNPVKK